MHSILRYNRGRESGEPARHRSLQQEASDKARRRWPDIFGDGSLALLSTSGHTPGHQSLLVRLPETGAVILSGDAVHFQTSFEHRYVPSNNWSKQASLQSMDKIAALLAREHAQLWINHDQPQSDAQKRLPAYYE